MPDISREFDLLSEAEYANLTGRKIQAVRNERAKGRGPAFVRLGRTVKYRRSDVSAWIASRLVDPGNTVPTLVHGIHRRGSRAIRT